MYKRYILLIAAFCLLLPLMGVHPKTGILAQEKEAIVLVAFGNSLEQVRAAYTGVEEAVRAQYPDTPIHWLWLADPLLRIDPHSEFRKSIQNTLSTLADNGVKHIDVFALHVLPDAGYIDFLRIVRAFRDSRRGVWSMRLASPLLHDTQSHKDVAHVLLHSAPKERTKDDALVFVGHGTRHQAGVHYAALHYFVHILDKNAFVVTIDDTLPPDASLHALQAKAVRKVWLVPLMAVADENALNDIYGTGATSWHQRLAAQGMQVEPVRQGLGDNPAMVRQWLQSLERLRR